MSLMQFTYTVAILAIAVSMLVLPFTRSYFKLLRMFSLTFFEQERCWRSFTKALVNALLHGALVAAPFAMLITLGDHRLWNIAHSGAGIEVAHVHLPPSLGAVYNHAVRRFLIGLPGFFLLSACVAFLLRVLATMDLERHRKVLLAAVLFLLLSSLGFWWAISHFGW
ncbi:MAG: hypothetical protein KDD66_00675 [Bdellovibrionales bacterium]|nr:hypothetical protein [Bdellovibrionales bacterium]